MKIAYCKMNAEDIIIEFYKKGIFMTGTFKLSSGKISPYYIDLRKALAYPDLYTAIAIELLKTINKSKIEYSAIIGVATGGIPYATLLAALTLKPLGYVRVERKEYGTKSIVEGASRNHKVLIVDDVTTTGSNLVRAAEAVISYGGELAAFAVIVDREEGAEDTLKKYNKPLISLFKITKILNVLRDHGLISLEEYYKITEYLSK